MFTCFIKDILEVLEDKGDIPEDLVERLKSQSLAVLKDWFKVACSADSVNQFLNEITKN